MTDDRSDRLRKRRQEQERSDREAAADVDEPDEIDKPSKTDKVDKTSKPDDPSGADEGQAESGSIKDDQVGTYMYLPESQKKEIDRQYNLLKAEYEFEYDESFEKNRHFFPLLVQYGLDSLDSLDATEIKNLLDSL